MTKLSIIKSTFLALEVDGMSLISYVAMNGNNEAVQLLINLGGKLEDAFYGYAMAKNTMQIDSLTKTCPKAKLSTCIGKAIRGYARVGNVDAIYAIDQFRSYKSDLLLGLAQSGDQDKVTPLLDREIGFFRQVVEGYASCDKSALLSKLIKGTCYYPLAIYYAARSGHTNLVNDLFQQCGIADFGGLLSQETTAVKRIDDYSLINCGLKGYVVGCHFKEAVHLLERNASIAHCVLDLKDTFDLPNRELYLAFLAHIKNQKLKETVLNEMTTLGNVTDSLKISATDIEQLKKITTCMNKRHLNYIEARNQIEQKSPDAAVEGEITLSFLADIVSGEMTKMDPTLNGSANITFSG